jgi:acetoin utilization deacetylase AcuC-like enzyme
LSRSCFINENAHLSPSLAGALHALEGNGGRLARRVAVVDFDVHHGNGTEEIARAWHERHRRSTARAGGAAARDDRDVFFASIHLADDGKGSGVEFYPGTGATSDLHQNVVNVVVPPMWRAQENVSDGVGARKRVPKRNRDDELDGSGAALTAAKAKEKKEEEKKEALLAEALKSSPSTTATNKNTQKASLGGREEWMRRLRDRVLPALRAFKPDLLIISAGFDAANHDVGNVGVDRRGRRAGGANLTPEDYEEMTNRLCAVASSAGGKVVSVLEGGYGHLVENPADGTASLNRENFAACVVAHVRGLAGLGAPVKD